jgi:hypothetical protein
MIIIEFFSYMLVNYKRKHQCEKTSKGSRHMKPCISSTQYLIEKSRERKKTRKAGRKII